ncbi:MAG: hypothetical protein QM564_10105 [Bergeyella sp.]
MKKLALCAFFVVAGAGFASAQKTEKKEVAQVDAAVEELVNPNPAQKAAPVVSKAKADAAVKPKSVSAKQQEATLARKPKEETAKQKKTAIMQESSTEEKRAAADLKSLK